MCRVRPAPEPDPEPRAPPRVPLVPGLKKSVAWSVRDRLWKKINAWEEGRFLSDADRYLLNWFVAGVSDCFKGDTFVANADTKFEAIWDAINNPEQMYEMANGPVYKFCEDLLNDLETDPNDPVILQLTETGVFRHTLMLIVDTEK